MERLGRMDVIQPELHPQYQINNRLWEKKNAMPGI